MTFPSGSIVVMDRAYNDYRFFSQLSKDDVTFVTRIKDNADFDFSKKKILAQDEKGTWGDYLIKLESQTAQDSGKTDYRLVQWHDVETGRWFEFITNSTKLSAVEVQALYRERWNIELFFKKLKQNLKIKTFLGASFNAVMSQVWVAAIAFLMIEVLRRGASYKWSFSNLVHNLRLNLLCFKKLHEWLDTPLVAKQSTSSEDPQHELFNST